MGRFKCVLFNLVLLNVLILSFCHNKYSQQANAPVENFPQQKSSDDFDFRPTTLKHLDKPFRMAKLNLLWSKAVIRLSEPKLKSLFGALKLHDKEEITWKHLRAEGKDKDGLKEADLRRKLIEIMSHYELLDQLEDVHNSTKHHPHRALNEASDKHINKSIFKDKKLNKLWEKAEIAGFTNEELAALKEEFFHHQDKVDQYYSLLQDVKVGVDDSQHENSVDEKLDRFNKIETEEEPAPPNKDYLDKVNLLREKHKDIKEGYDHLFMVSSKGPNSKEFVEPKVQGLWKIAIESKFSADELESLRVELRHYENRLLKLRHLQAEVALNEEKYKKMKIHGTKSDGQTLMEDTIKKNARKVEKLHEDLESRILYKHLEL